MEEYSIGRVIRNGFVSGVSWSFGATVGFVLVSIILAFVLQELGGLPFVGSFFASIVEATVEQLTRRTPVIGL
ncbi:MAG: hypothetical protein UW23_C0032G0007 [Candidatus Collierbacteria bacterium GW2011_GWA1_44_12]|uniref:Uncharacterized protein n=2 Tax=Candidatus Collieribacteriota TaxID=1752725 RepID=A0A0G1S831_9BACT|nr:MAG: hypothetical protein UW23_C0032G0007 [Candidatus Collierbacteria bacterium GW2011_GWA1_44_12]KKU29475.1 MAG: hypothetical protein UX41_C0018G0007 [Candidatus Collierbacteria bacterium GW2011_GWE1_46_18]